MVSEGVGRRLYEARRARDMTMSDLGNKIKISGAAISLIEAGKRRVTTEIVEKLAWALNVDPCWLAYGTGSKPDWLSAEKEG